jgi:hypothetical protein
MSRITQIEQALLRINGAIFEKLCGMMLYLEGYKNLFSIGTVIAKEKTRQGTPDIYIPIGKNEYIFVEVTTQERLGESKSFFKKLSKDIDDCFDEKKSKIKNEQIVKVVLCFTQKVKEHEYGQLSKKCNEHNADLELYPIDRIARIIALTPSLGKPFLNISIDTGQILLPPIFIKEYEKGNLATSLSNQLFFRETEIQTALDSLTKHDILIFEGKPGVGKSRLALEVLRQYCELHDTYTSICIDNKGCSIDEDIRMQLQNDKNYILLIDDANRAAKHYKFLVNLLKEERAGHIKLIVTVRDYALESIKDISMNFSYEIKINTLSDGQILQILESNDFKILNKTYSDIIVDIAKGNPRLAIMAAKVALEKNSLEAFNDIYAIYDNYYGAVVKEIDKLDNVLFLKVLGLIAFFRVLGKKYYQIESILSVFNIDVNAFWEIVIPLHQMELVDLYEDEVVKISDQVLGDYFFYKVFLCDKILDFSSLLIHFYGENQARCRDVVYSVANTFGGHNVHDKIKHSIASAWSHFASDESALLKFLSVFWVFEEDKTLNYIGEVITSLPESSVTEYVFEKKNNDYAARIDSDGYFNTLKQFLKRPVPSDNYALAIDLLFLFLKKRPNYIAEFIQLIKGIVSFGTQDYQYGYFRQSTFFDRLFSTIENESSSPLYKGIFYHIANLFLQTSFQHSTGRNRENVISIYTISAPRASNTLELREKIWKCLFKHFERDKEDVFKVIQTYITQYDTHLAGGDNTENKQFFWALDAPSLLPFVREHFDQESYEHCKYVQEYLKELKMLKIPYDEKLVSLFTNSRTALAAVLDQNLIYGKSKFDWHKEPSCKDENGRTNHSVVEQLKLKELEDYISNFGLEEYKKLWQELNQILHVEADSAHWKYKKSFTQILASIATHQIAIFLEFFGFILDEDECFAVDIIDNRDLIINNALLSLEENHRELYALIDQYEGQYIFYWKFAFFCELEAPYIDTYYAQKMYAALGEIEQNWCFFDLEFLKKYRSSFAVIQQEQTAYGRDDIYIVVVRKLLQIAEEKNIRISFGLQFISKHKDIFVEHFDLLQQVYFANYIRNPDFDYQGTEMKSLCALNPMFVNNFMHQFCKRKYAPSRHSMPLAVQFVWEMQNYSQIIDGLIEFLKKKIVFSDTENALNALFNNNTPNSTSKQLQYIDNYITNNANDTKGMKIIFNVIIYSFYEKRLEYLKKILVVNDDIKLFKQLNFYQSNVYSGSRVPILEKRVDFMNKIMDLLDSFPNTMNFLQHKLVVRNKIEGIQQEILREKQREFEDFYK